MRKVKGQMWLNQVALQVVLLKSGCLFGRSKEVWSERW